MSDLLDILLDENNRDPIVLKDETGNALAFEQVAVIPYSKAGEWVVYVVLKPIDVIEGIGDDEAAVFYVEEDESGNMFLRIEQDELIAIEIFNQYYDLLEKVRKGKRGN